MKRLAWTLALTATPLSFAQVIQPWPARWSQTYGPDGPWNTVRVAFGTPPQYFDALPAGQWNSWILRKDICKKALPSRTCFAQDAGTYDPTSSRTYINTSLVYTSLRGGFFEPSEFTFGDYEAALDELSIDPAREELKGVHIHNHTSFIVENAYRTLPNGTRYSVALSTLSLGGPDAFQNWVVDGYRYEGLLVSNDIHTQRITDSNAYGLHIGSPTVKLGGSLFFGGYDRFRVVGPTSAQPFSLNTLPIALLDIGIGVAEGKSPFAFASRQGLLAEGNSSFSGVPSLMVDVEGRDPYLYLPRSTCEAIAKNMPVRFDPGLGLYLWQTEDPNYKKIAFSPAFLSFTFRANNSASQNITIKVPFRLLSLTLSEPLASPPAQYFPCATPQVPGYRLGRAFMQAAFVSVNWMQDYKGVWMLAQAAGPNIPESPDVTVIGAQDRTLRASDSSWELSWQGVWAPIAANGSQEDVKPGPGASDGPSASASSSVSSVALTAGLTVMAVVIVTIGLALVYLFYRRRGRVPRGTQRDSPLLPPGYQRRELHADDPLTKDRILGGELYAQREPAELPPAKTPAPTWKGLGVWHPSGTSIVGRQPPVPSPIELDAGPLWSQRTRPHSHLSSS